MKYLFSEMGEQVVESLSFTRTLYAFDFDGTLVPIVASPELVRISRETEKLLHELASCAAVLIISGRSVADLSTHITLGRKYLIGNHGLEGLGGNKETIAKCEAVCSKWLNQLQRGWDALKSDTGTFIENKKYSLALHYRKSRNKKNARLELFSLIEKLQPPPRVILGKCVMNLIPAGGPHKGVALLEAMMKLNLKCAFYIGDDDTDEDVFTLPDNRIITVRVGRRSTSQAQFFLKRQSEINKLLRNLIKINQKSTLHAGV
ncbi:MAG: trehalose-phosphatase [Bdellovibrionales bacterium GWA2_49_15]|nr:MAG: trehalose-phosphatase [Bdellovibrionales bacterium GWA2_49_15]HAZ14672.1 trehalose-phosphatase [Bdellovibrionales bacterium]